MKTSLDLRQLADRIMKDRDAKTDIIADTRNINLVQHDDRVDLAVEGQGEFNVLPLAHQQLGQRLNVPKRHYDRLLRDHPDLLVNEVNTLMHREPERRMIRALRDDSRSVARAFLSDRYKRIDNEEVASVVLPILQEIPDVQIVSCAVTETKLHIKAVAPRIQGEVKRGDLVQAGIAISNSEVGLGALSVQRLAYRLVCLNGMIMPDGKLRAYHVGARAAKDDDVYELLSDETKAADDKAILLKVRDVVRGSVDQGAFDLSVAKMRSATEDRIEGDIVKAVEVVSKKVNATEAEQNDILRHLIEGGDLSRWGILNAVTRASQDVEDYDRATDLEVAGGMILDLPRSEWREVALAA